MLSGLKQNPYITQTDLAKELSLSRRTVQRIMKELINDGKIKRVGSTRTGHWEINDWCKGIVYKNYAFANPYRSSLCDGCAFCPQVTAK